VSPLRGEKPQNWPLSKLNTGRFALRAMLPVMTASATQGGHKKATNTIRYTDQSGKTLYATIGSYTKAAKDSLHFLWPPYKIGQAIIVCPVVSFLLSFFLSFLA